MMTLYVVLGVVLLWLAFSYNGLVVLSTKAQTAWSDIDIQLRRRYDLIPNLVNAVKGYATHEQGTFEKITEARAAAMQAGSVEKRGEAENALSGTLKSLFAISEAYPDLKANQNFMSLQQELSDTEDKIQSARRFYNGNVREFNIAVATFPRIIAAIILGYRKMEFFQLGDAEAAAPVEVKF